MAVEGSLDLFQLPEILQIIAQEKKTGILTVQGETDIVAISFLEGDVVAADALNQTREEGLGEILAQQGMLAPAQLEAAIREQRRSGGRLLDILVGDGSLPRPRLLEALRLQTIGLLQDLLAWREGDFKFYSGDEVSYEEGFIPISVQDLLLRSLAQEEGKRRREAAKEPPRPVEPPQASVAPSPPPAPRLEPATATIQPSVPASQAAVEPSASLVEAFRVPSDHRAAETAPGAPVVIEIPDEVVVRPTVAVSRLLLAVGRLLALVGAAGILTMVFTTPADLLYPPPLRGEREVFEAARAQALAHKIDGAVKTYFLLEGSMPQDLGRLTTLGLLSQRDLRDPQGRPMAYSAQEVHYRLPGLAAGGSLRGNFLLDRDFLQGRTAGMEPLVLLD